MYERLLGAHLAKSWRSVLLLGPRQVGKSTLLEALNPDFRLNFADPATLRAYVKAPDRLARELKSRGRGVRTVLLDEIQRLPELLDSVQVLIDDEPKRYRFLVSGSSARKLRRGQANLLPGRVNVHYLQPLLAAELGSEWSLERAIAHGSLPGVWAETDADARGEILRSYADTYLREEVQAEALVRNLGGYARLLDLLAASSGRILNLHALCGDAGLGFETARRYVEVLEDTLVLFRVPAWAGTPRARFVAHPKVYLFDIGVRNALLRRPLDESLDDERGLLVEHLVALELRARMGRLWPEMALHHYRTRTGMEVDFVLAMPRELWGIEVKASTRVDRSDLKGLASLSGAFPRVKRKIVVFLGPRAQKFDDVEVLPLEQFLGELPS